MTTTSNALPQVHLAGYLDSTLGLGESGRWLARALEAVEIRPEPVVVALDQSKNAEIHGPDQTDRNDNRHPGIGIVSLNGEALETFAQRGGRPLIESRYIISTWYWETQTLPEETARGLRLVDEVWATTDFVAKAIESRAEGVPVRRIRHPFEAPRVSRKDALAAFPFDGRFVFLLTFDFNSCVLRKNPDAVCEAFTRAFPEPREGGPLCVIKSINGAVHPHERRLLEWKWAARRDVVFLDALLPAAQRDLLARRADCCVSLHRAEGLGLTMMEAMSLGIPTIGTNYSGNLDFMDPGNSWLVGGTRIPVGSGSLHYPAGDEWMDPDVAEAAAAMRAIFDDPAAARPRAEAGQARIESAHNLKTTGAILAELIHTAAGLPIRKKGLDLPRGSGWRADAFGTLRELRELEGEANGKNRERLLRRALSETLKAVRTSDQRTRAVEQSLARKTERLQAQIADILNRI